MFDLTSISEKLPTVVKPVSKLTFRDKLKWTFLILIFYFILGSILVYGVNPEAVAQFEFMEIVFGSKFGSLLTLGIGPIVTASIILQLLVGSKIIDWDIHGKDKAKFAGTQKILAVLFCFFEAIAFVVAGAVPPSSPAFALLVILQLAAGGIIVIFMDEVCSKWGFGSGISLFIAAGVSKTIFLRTFAIPLGAEGSGGVISTFILNLAGGQPLAGFEALMPLIATIFVFVIVVFSQAMKVEIPMAFSVPFGKFASRRWPLKFIYASNIPVILVAAVLANVQILGSVLASRGITLLGEFDENKHAINGIAYLLTPPHSLSLTIMVMFAGVFAVAFVYMASRFWRKYALRSSVIGAAIGIMFALILMKAVNLPNVTLPTSSDGFRALIYMLVMVFGSIIFSIFWVNTAGMDAHTVAEQFKSANLMIPGFRRDPRIIESVLGKYIPALSVLGGAFVGFLAGFADLTGALGSGTGILLAVMIIYQFYENIMREHGHEMPEFVRRIAK